jgi:mRNA interferase RelE/StbE
MYQVSYLSEVKDDLSSVSTADKKRIKLAIEGKLQTEPIIFGKPLQHSLKGLRSLRVGDYRVVFQLKKKEVLIVLIAHRSVVYSLVNKRATK